MRNKLKVLFSLFLIYACVSSVWGLPARDVQVIKKGEYFDQVHSLITKASGSIYLMMYSFKYYPRYPNSPSNILMQDLIKANRRKVKVAVLLDVSEFQEENSQANKEMGKLLSSQGIEVHYDSLTVNTHAKVLVVDSRYTVVGSTNWTYHALTDNNEAAVFIDSEEVAKEMEGYIKKVIIEEGESLRSRNFNNK